MHCKRLSLIVVVQFSNLSLVVAVIAVAVIDYCVEVLRCVHSQFLLLLQLLLQLRLLSVAIGIIIEVAIAVIVFLFIVAYPQSFLWLVFGCPCSRCRHSCGSHQSVVAFWSLFALAVFDGCPCGRRSGWLLYLPLRSLLKLHHLPSWLWLLSVVPAGCALAVVFLQSLCTCGHCQGCNCDRCWCWLSQMPLRSLSQLLWLLLQLLSVALAVVVGHLRSLSRLRLCHCQGRNCACNRFSGWLLQLPMLHLQLLLVALAVIVSCPCGC